MKAILFLLVCLFPTPSFAAKILNLNVFDQLQGEWEPNFRATRMKALSGWILKERPDVVVLQEARADSATSTESTDVAGFRKLYPYAFYVHEMTGKDGASYGYWLGSRKKPDATYTDGFSFPGGVERKVQGAIWKNFSGGKCLGVLHLHLSYQTSEVRVKEAEWVQKWIAAKSPECDRWVVAGDFNADADSAEIRHLQETGFVSLLAEKKPTVGAFNPIRQIYGKDIPSKTIDWAFGWGGVKAVAKVVLDSPLKGIWISDHAGVLVQLK